LLFPDVFGLMALVQIFMQGLAMFSDIGIGPSLIQHKRGDDPTFRNTAWTIQIIRGVMLWITSCFIAWPVAKFYGQPMLLQLLPVAGLGAFISGFNSTSVFIANRKLALGRITALDLVSQVVSLVLTCILAVCFHSVWSLLVGSLLGGTVYTVLTHIILL